ncbi:SCP2 sterol-binding domain-containing protein [Salinivibrio kushneri]|uniref:SCP2 sterol-binding domain-containing protein n=1 Tax=Salinivibrio kushneri TaxID=1908198 RepID=UPI0022B53A2C|nr:SCP2 sterol-binding domain-containing protein [Salinivibrio kushneri]WBA17120.1 hypothetical protein O4598_08165 [Salinivibrio kushneri]
MMINKRLLNAALVLIPNKQQTKAVAKALNFLLVPQRMALEESRVVQFEVTDLAQSWWVSIDQTGVYPSTNANPADLIVRAPLSTILAAQDHSVLQGLLNDEQVQIEGTAHDKALLDAALQTITPEQLEALVDRCYVFLRLKRTQRFNVQSVTLADLKTAADVDWVRDTAVKLELTHPQEAWRLMELAHQARPSGPFIARKVKEYRQALTHA